MSNTGKTVSVVITADNHKHEGVLVPKGASIETDAATAKWLTKTAKVGEIVSTAEAGKKGDK